MDITKGIAVVYLAKDFLGITASHFAALGVFFGHLFSVFSGDMDDEGRSNSLWISTHRRTAPRPGHLSS